ncbi:MAG: hypothetical protein BJ554DRAFT_2107 [Olpidium bornovanus]|uniref:Programmed cell death protein 5 n=1 Tax=Olpidium bornovanus TaxID=278681 RepID=A0A8H8DGW5_9FUNG|nr:MAG: hypothetical protein BJ554DRAFT_2107 [Olpidium bornovanus]
MEEMRRSMVRRSCESRVSRITLVKPQKARGVEDLLIRMARGGQLRQKVGETELRDLLGQIADSQPAAKKITYSRRVSADDSDDDYGL